MALHLVTGYAGSAHIKPTDTGSFNAAMFSSGNFVLSRGNQFAANALTANSVQIKDGDLIMQGRHVRLNAGGTETVTIESGTQGMLRHDLIVCRYSKNSGTGVEFASFEVIKGTAVNSNPKDPDFITGDILDGSAATCDFPLYRVNLDGINIAGIDALFTVYTASDMAKVVYDPAGTVKSAGGVPGYVSGQVNPVANRVTNLENKTRCFECTLDANSWSTSAPYKQTVAVSGVTDAWIPGTPTFKPDALLSAPDKLNLRLQEFAKVNMVESGSGKLTFTCFEEKPTGHLYLRIPGVMKP